MEMEPRIRFRLFCLVLMGFFCSSQGYIFYAGGRDGWVLNPSQKYNDWAARNRFQVNDTIFFKYKKGSDSVLVVSKEDYDKCNTAKPIMKMEGGDSSFVFDRSGPFYFISGKPGRCENGQKLHLVVMAVRQKNPITPIPPISSPPSPTAKPPKTPLMPPSPMAQTPASQSPSPSSPVSPPTPATSPMSPSPMAGTPASSPTMSPSPTAGTPASSPTPAMTPGPASPTPEGPALSPTPATAPELSPSPTTQTPSVSPTPATSPPSPPSPSPEGNTPGASPPTPNAQTPGSGTPGAAGATPPGSSSNVQTPPPRPSSAPALSSSSFAFISGVSLVHGKGEDAIQCFKEMQESGSVEPDEATFTALLSACSHAGLLEDGRRVFSSMVNEYGIKPGIDHYSCIIDLLGRAGHLDEAEQLINAMPFQADYTIWWALLSACAAYGNVRLGRIAASFLLETEPNNPAVYVLLSNINACAGQWEEAADARNLMRRNGMMKQPGYSWIGVS